MNLILVLATLLFSSAQEVQIVTSNKQVPGEVLAVVAKTISAKCTDISNPDLELVSVTIETVKVDQGKEDTIYSLVLEVPNNTNDDDEDMFEVTVIDSAINNPTIENPSVTSLVEYGWMSCK